MKNRDLRISRGEQKQEEEKDDEEKKKKTHNAYTNT